jgi:hypothetical protein
VPSRSLSVESAPPASTAPTEIREGVWFVGHSVISFDGTHRLTLRDDELPGSADAGRVATVERPFGNGSQLRIYDLQTGALVQDVHRDRVVAEVVLVGDATYFIEPPAGAPWRDTGLLRLNATGDVEVVGSIHSDDGKWSRALLARSPSGLSLATQVQEVDAAGRGIGRRSIEISTSEGSTTTVAIGDTNLIAISDEVVITRNATSTRAYSVTDGLELWNVAARGTGPGYVTSDGRFVQLLLRDQWELVVIDIDEGIVLRRFTTDGGDLDATASSDRIAVLRSADGTTATLVDLELGAIRSAPLPSE